MAPRPGLTRQRLVEAAAALVDEQGPEGLALAPLAKRFGVRTPSLYNHVRSLADLRHALTLQGLADLDAALGRAAAGRAGRDALVAVAHAYRAYARAHPGRYAMTLPAPGGEDAAHEEAAARVLGTVLAVLTGYGLDGEDAIDATRVVRSALHGFVALEVAGGFGLPQDVDRSYHRLVAALDAALSGWAAP